MTATITAFHEYCTSMNAGKSTKRLKNTRHFSHKP